VTIADVILNATKRLEAARIQSARFDVELLLCRAMGRDRAWLLAHRTDALNEDLRTTLEQYVNRRARREPLQYIIGIQEFWGLKFTVTRDMLIPRPETELIIDTVLRNVADKRKPLRIVDLCTGSGCIAVSLASELPAAQVIATDTSLKALAVARENAGNHGMVSRIHFIEGDLFTPLEHLDIHGSVDIIVSNPPYVPLGDFDTLQPEVRDYEPTCALLAGTEGTEVHGRIIGAAPRFLNRSGTLIMEMGLGQAATLARMIKDNGQYGTPDLLKDLAGIDRVIMAHRL